MCFEFFTYLVYSPRGTSINAQNSRKLLGLCKNGNLRFSERIAQKIVDYGASDFFEDAVLVPIPRSSPLLKGAVFPAKVIAEGLVSRGLGTSVIECLSRVKVIPKSSSQFSAESRNSVEVHLESLAAEPRIFGESYIVLVDDVLTLGRTAMACAIKLMELYPDKKIRIFTPFRTRSFKDEDLLISPNRDFMRLSNSGKVQLPD